MNGQDLWYYIDESETRGPVPSAQVVQMIKAGLLSPAAQVAQAGWQVWKPASEVLPITEPGPPKTKMYSQPGSPQPQPVAAPVNETPRSAQAAYSVQTVYNKEPREGHSPSAAAMAEVSSISNRVSQVPATALLGGLRRTGIAVAAVLLAFTAGFAAKKFADANEREAQQTPRAEEVVKRTETYRKAGLDVPSEYSLTVRQWARLDPDEFNKKEQSLETVWRQFGQAQRLLQQIENDKKMGLVFPPNLAAATPNQLARLSPEEFQRTEQSVDELAQQFRHKQVEERRRQQQDQFRQQQQQQQQLFLEQRQRQLQNQRLPQRGR